ncbi:thyroid transcription factor 1-associated protein 26 homolog [Leptopilina boulardi]|uniref:thyroid transcription factor 1-associated protein 26 homolog n=1 Tax=Leptopilina boulardi TaxID=63433 RepID=UPI0021F5925A|nr:thyroid transcription factor 1-associated protein 26 homolog [Leptopilina boulardi]
MKERVISRKENKKTQGEKKPFDKKKYRLQKYSNKFKVNQWEERRKKAVIRNFYKEQEKDRKNAPGPSNLNVQDDKSSPNKKNPYFAAKAEFQKKKQEKKNKKEQIEQIKAERIEALKKYKEKKMQIYKKLSKKTKKGQPVMKDRMELLFEKIQQST